MDVREKERGKEGMGDGVRGGGGKRGEVEEEEEGEEEGLRLRERESVDFISHF